MQWEYAILEHIIRLQYFSRLAIEERKYVVKGVCKAYPMDRQALDNVDQTPHRED